MPVTVAGEMGLESFVILPLGSQRIALPADSVVELVAAGRVQSFPHGTPWISGVMVRRNRIVPVGDLERLFKEKPVSANRFHVIAEWQSEKGQDWCAIPVCGECELKSASVEAAPADGDSSPAVFDFVTGVIHRGGERIRVIDLSRLIRARQLALEKPMVELAP